MPPIANELTELVFERLDWATASRVSHAILGRSLVPPTSDDGVAETSIPRVEIGSGAILVDARLRLLRYGKDVYDVELNFIPSLAEYPPGTAMIELLHRFANSIGKAHQVDRYYAGIEPASDEETRFFTGAERGPYF